MSQNTSITGRWHGRYTYLDGGEGEAFEADLIESQDAIIGTTTETSNLHDGFQGARRATISGSRNGSIVSFVKHYARGHGHDQPIKYDGEVNDDATEIEGIWRIDRNAFGRFLMIRDLAMPHAVAVKAEEKVR
jgi:hypothetical protein